MALIWGISNCLPYRFLAFTSYLTTENTHSSTREISVRLIGMHLSRVPSFVPAACHPALLAACHWSFTGSGAFLPHRISSRPCRWLLSRRWFLPLAPKCHTNNKYLQIVGMSNGAYRPGQRMKRLAWSSGINGAPQLYCSALVISLSCSIYASVGLVAANVHLHLVVSRLNGYYAGLLAPG